MTLLKELKNPKERKALYELRDKLSRVERKEQRKQQEADVIAAIKGEK